MSATKQQQSAAIIQMVNYQLQIYCIENGLISKDRCWKRFVVSSNIWIYVINPQNVKQDDFWRSAVENFFLQKIFSIWPTVQIHFQLKNLHLISKCKTFLIKNCQNISFSIKNQVKMLIFPTTDVIKNCRWWMISRKRAISIRKV